MLWRSATGATARPAPGPPPWPTIVSAPSIATCQRAIRPGPISRSTRRSPALAFAKCAPRMIRSSVHSAGAVVWSRTAPGPAAVGSMFRPPPRLVVLPHRAQLRPRRRRRHILFAWRPSLFLLVFMPGGHRRQPSTLIVRAFVVWWAGVRLVVFLVPMGGPESE